MTDPNVVDDEIVDDIGHAVESSEVYTFIISNIFDILSLVKFEM